MPKATPQVKNPHLPLIQPYSKSNDRNVRRWRIKQRNPVKISKGILKRVLAEIKEEDDSKPKHRLITQYGPGGEVALTTCTLPSSELLTVNPASILLHSASTLLHELRKALLNHDWNFSSQLLQALVRSKLINKRLLMFVIRSSLMILLNNCQHPEILEEFLTLAVGLNDESKMNEFLNSIFQFPKEMKIPNPILPKEQKKPNPSKNKKTGNRSIEKKTPNPPKEKKTPNPPKEKKTQNPPKEKRTRNPPKEKKITDLPKVKKTSKSSK